MLANLKTLQSLDLSKTHVTDHDLLKELRGTDPP